MGGLALKSLQWLLRLIEFICAGIVLGIFSYFLATLHDHSLHIDNYVRAVEGISGAAALYLIFGLVLVWCLGGVAFFSFLGILLDLGFTGAFIYVAFENRHGANSCTGNVNTVFGSGPANSKGDGGTHGVLHLPKLKTACRLETAAFSVSIVAIFLFLISAFIEFLLARNHRKEKAFGPSPNNNYTQGTGRRRFPWQRNPKPQIAVGAGGLHPDALPLHQTPADMTDVVVPVRKSYQSGSEATSTAVGGESSVGVISGYKKYENGGGFGGNNVGGNGYGDGRTGVANTHTAPYPPDDMNAYDRYGHSAGYQQHQMPDAGERAEMPAEIPVSQVARNY